METSSGESSNKTTEQGTTSVDSRASQDISSLLEGIIMQTQERFQTMSEQILTRIDDMAKRVDDLEKNISDLMTEAGVGVRNE